MITNNLQKPDFYLIKTETKETSAIYSSFVKSRIKLNKKTVYKVEIYPFDEPIQADCKIKNTTVLLTPRTTRIRILPWRKHKFLFNLMYLWHPCSIYIIKYDKSFKEMEPNIKCETVEISNIGEIHLTVDAAKKALNWWSVD